MDGAGGGKNEAEETKIAANDDSATPNDGPDGSTTNRGQLSPPPSRPLGNRSSSDGKNTEVVEFIKLFDTTLKEVRQERKNNKPSASTLEAQKWYEGLGEEERDLVDHGIRAITYRGCMDAAKQKYDSLVEQAKRVGKAQQQQHPNGKRDGVRSQENALLPGLGLPIGDLPRVCLRGHLDRGHRRAEPRCGGFAG